ncbi:alpha/beta hydrolase family protein [Kitasatospora azatica]|uniref:alpha/beta hydrolase family protein n=1 Tax=Kitasatospora azatica TaxID=58347 RepID=UPI00069137C7|nr:alpha/beta hydrolase [Kitasatospora azatica]
MDSREVLTRPAPPVDHTLRYGEHPDQVVDLRLPPGLGPAPLLVLLHGGFWQPEYDRSHTGPLASALAEAGHLVAVPEYRRSGWPDTFDDVAAALDLLAGPLPHPVTGRTVLVGHSAGGHLALWAAARRRLPADSPWSTRRVPDAVVVLAGCSCLDLCADWGLGEDAVLGLLGGGPGQVPQRYALADPAALLPLGVPVTLLHGTEDRQVPVAMSREYARRATAAGDPVTLLESAGTDHFHLIDPLAAVWPTVLATLTAAGRRPVPSQRTQLTGPS